MKRFTLISTLALLAMVWTGCNGGPTGPSFVVGTDAPLASVASFSVQIMSIKLTDSSGNTASLISGQPTVDFAQYNGLQTLLDMNHVPGGTYSGVLIALNGSGVLGYLNTSTPGVAPTIATEPVTLTPSTVNLTLDKPLVVAPGGAPVGLRLDFDLPQSITVDSSGNISNMVTPTFHVNTLSNNDNRGHIDELIAAVVGLPSGTPPSEPNSFMIEGPHGQQFTINTTAQTEWDGSASLSALTTSSIVLVSGQLDRADSTLDADEVAILSQNGFYAGGLVTYVTPATGPASSFDLYVRGVLPMNVTGVQLGSIPQVNVNGTEEYSLYWMHNSFAQFTQSLFSQSGLLAGQSVAVGGPTSTYESNGTVNRVTLRNWGYMGTVVAGSENAGNGTFEMQVNGFAGVVIPETVTVHMGGTTDFRFGFSAFGDLTDGANVRVVGLLVKNPTTGRAVLLARHVDGFDFTNFN
jgi:hypothetical protein